MARRSWLDPLARRLLIASGQIQPPSKPLPPPPPAGSEPDAADRAEQVERDLLALRLAQNPGLPLRDAAEVRRAAALGWWLDVNRATAADWRRLPGCGPEQVDLLVRLQRGGVQLSGPEDLRQLLQLDGDTLRGWLPLLRFHWYGAPPEPPRPRPVAVNQASAADLERLPELSADRCARLLRERARRPFRDLADLRDRLGLPPAVAEQWIGRVSFSPGPAGPRLPPASGRRSP
jgi:DNA uptake protein ComE-like DNA-binding protein